MQKHVQHACTFKTLVDFSFVAMVLKRLSSADFACLEFCCLSCGDRKHNSFPLTQVVSSCFVYLHHNLIYSQLQHLCSAAANSHGLMDVSIYLCHHSYIYAQFFNNFSFIA